MEHGECIPRGVWLGLIGVLAGVILLYLPPLSGDFVYDDQAFIVDNAHVRHLDQWPAFWTDQTTLSRTGHGIWRPLRTLSFALDYRLWGLRTIGYHLTSLLVHVVNVWLIWQLSLWLWRQSRWKTEAHRLALATASRGGVGARKPVCLPKPCTYPAGSASI